MTEDTKVHALFGVAALPSDSVSSDVRHLVADLAKQLEQGEIAGLAVVVVRPNRSVDTTWAPGSAPANLIIAGCARLQHLTIQALIEDIETDDEAS